MSKYEKVFIGIDQSYKNTGISIAADGELKIVRSLHLEKCKCNSEKRKMLNKKLDEVIRSVQPQSQELVCIIERIRLQSSGFLNIDYIKSIGALNSVIVDKCKEYGIQVFSVDTRCWKAQVVGTSKPKENKYGVPPEKWPTVLWVIKHGFRNQIISEVTGRACKGTFIHDGKKLRYNDDASDSAGIAMFGFLGDKEKLKEEH